MLFHEVQDYDLKNLAKAMKFEDYADYSGKSKEQLEIENTHATYGTSLLKTSSYVQEFKKSNLTEKQIQDAINKIIEHGSKMIKFLFEKEINYIPTMSYYINNGSQFAAMVPVGTKVIENEKLNELLG